MIELLSALHFLFYGFWILGPKIQVRRVEFLFFSFYKYMFFYFLSLFIIICCFEVLKIKFQKVLIIVIFDNIFMIFTLMATVNEFFFDI